MNLLYLGNNIFVLVCLLDNANGDDYENTD